MVGKHSFFGKHLTLRPAEFRQPFRAGTAAAHGSIRLAFEANGFGQQPFESIPEMDAVKHGIQNIGDGAVMAVFWIGVIERVMFRGL